MGWSCDCEVSLFAELKQASSLLPLLRIIINWLGTNCKRIDHTEGLSLYYMHTESGHSGGPKIFDI